jgi:hypothetical protein
MPPEFVCQFRSSLKKRAPIDGFPRDDIFYIDPEGKSTAACVNEACYLLMEVALPQFDSFSDLSQAIQYMEGTIKYPDGLPGLGVGIYASPTSYLWKELLATLRLLKHCDSPSIENENAALNAIDETIGAIFDFHGVDYPVSVELDRLRIQQFFGKLSKASVQSFISHGLPLPQSFGSESARINPQEMLAQKAPPSFGHDAKKQLWQFLKSAGFSEFTERLAHRIFDNSIEVVEIVPVDRMECKAQALPGGLFRISLGLYLPLLEESPPRTNRSGLPMPTVRECLLRNWLFPDPPNFSRSRSAFGCAADAQNRLMSHGLGWFSLFQQPHMAMSVLLQPNSEIFASYPMMRGMGSRSSSKRLILLAYFANILKKDAEVLAYLHDAEKALTSYHEHLRPQIKKILDQMSSGIMK